MLNLALFNHKELELMTKKIVVILGATCDLGLELSKIYAENNYDLIIVSRNKKKNYYLKNLIENENKNTKVINLELDILDIENHSKIFNSIEKPIDGIISLIGETHNIENIKDEKFINLININYTYLVNFLSFFLDDFEKKNKGFLICLSSVAGLRGRGKNFIYGSAKAALINFLSGVRNYYKNSNLFIMTVLPGFINNKESRLNKLEKLFAVNPSSLANKIFFAHQKKEEVIYSSLIWRLIMLIITMLPNIVFNKLKF